MKPDSINVNMLSDVTTTGKHPVLPNLENQYKQNIKLEWQHLLTSTVSR